MNFSMPSYLIGVGTVAGAIALGFGGGVVLTSSAVKDTAGQTRVERLAHSTPAPAPSVPANDAPKIEARVVPLSPAAQPAQPADAEVNQAVVQSVPQSAPPAPQTQQAAIVPGTRADQPSAAASTWRDDQERTARQQRVQRRAERRRIYAQQKAKALAVARMRQPQFEEQQSARPELAFEREDDGFGFFGRSSSRTPADRN